MDLTKKYIKEEVNFVKSMEKVGKEEVNFVKSDLKTRNTFFTRRKE